MHPSPNPSPNQAYSQMDDDLHVEVTPEEVAPVFPSYHPLPSYRLRRWAHGPRLCPLVITPVLLAAGGGAQPAHGQVRPGARQVLTLTLTLTLTRP